MSHKKNKVTNLVISQLREIAAGLPPYPKYNAAGQPVYKMSMVDGQELINSGQVDATGKPGVPGVKYKVPVLVYADHFMELMAIYQAQGMEGVERDAKIIREAHEKKLKAIEDQLAAQPGPHDRIIHYVEDRIAKLNDLTLNDDEEEQGLKDFNRDVRLEIISELQRLLKFIKS